jgi:hypothetical protein
METFRPTESQILYIVIRLAPENQLSIQFLWRLEIALLSLSGILNNLIALSSCIAMLWCGAFLPFLATALTLPSFLLLFLRSARLLAGFLWLLTAAFTICFYLAVRINYFASHSEKVLFSIDGIGTLFNKFTLYLVCVFAIAQLAATCPTRRQIESPIAQPNLVL